MTEPGAGTELGPTIQELAYAGLDGLRSAVSADLCAYLHAGASVGPQLYLRAPDLSSLDSTAAFALFSSLRDVLANAEPGTRRVRVAEFDSVAVLSAHGASRGLFVLGRRSEPLTDAELELVSGICVALGMAAQAVEAADQTAAEAGPLKLTVEVAEQMVRAEVVVPVTGNLRQGRGEGMSPTDAVARATLDALDRGLKLVGLDEGDVAGERFAAALVRDPVDRVAAGAAVAGNDPLHAAAAATLDAAAKLGAYR